MYLGLCLVVAGIVLLFTRWHWRRYVLPVGVLLAFVAVLLPAPEIRIATPRTRLDEFAPAWQFNEVHSIRTAAPCVRACTALKEVTAGEIRFFRTLTWIRRFGRPGPEGILNAPEGEPVLEVATRTGFRILAEDTGREIVLGIRVIPPDRANGFMNFRLTELGTGCEISTETRVHAVEPQARREFAAYWRVIYPGSALIRRMWLRAISKRAEHSIQ